MSVNILSIEEVKPVEKSQLPNGTYWGTWGGYEVTFEIQDKTYRVRTEMGVRTISMPCRVTVLDGVVTVDTIK